MNEHLENRTVSARIVVVPGEGAFVLCETAAGPAAPAVLITLGPFLPYWSRHVARRFVFGGQKLVKLGGGFRCEDNRPPVTDIVLVVGHLEDGVCLGITATTWTIGGRQTGVRLSGRKVGEERKKERGESAVCFGATERDTEGCRVWGRRPPHLRAGVDGCGMSL